MKFEWVQPIDRPAFTLGAQGELEATAESVEQPMDLTRWLSTLKRGNKYVAPAWVPKPTIIVD